MFSMFSRGSTPWRIGDRPPVVVGAVGGSGTRAVVSALEAGGVFVGRSLNRSMDSVPGTAFIRSWETDFVPGGCRIPEGREEAFDRELEAAWTAHREGLSRADAAWAIKNPRWVFFLDALLERVPELRYVHVVRDGRDMAFSRNQSQVRDHGDSLLGPEYDDAEPAVRSMAFWNRQNLRALRTMRSLPDHRRLLIRFEDLCQDPGGVLPSLFEFVGRSDPDLTAAAGVIRRPDSIGRHRDEETELVRRISAVGAEALAALNYA